MSKSNRKETERFDKLKSEGLSDRKKLHVLLGKIKNADDAEELEEEVDKYYRNREVD